jgi:hypothetical protein
MSEERDYIAEMDARIEAATRGSDWVAAVVAEKLCGQLLENDPELLDGWLRAMAIPLLRRVIGLRVHHERRAAKRGARARAFAATAADLEAAEGGSERESAAAALLGMFSEIHVVDEDQTRKRAADMTGAEHLFVAENTYQRSANTALMLAAFHRAVAKKVGKKRTADVLSEQQYESMYISIVRKAA